MARYYLLFAFAVAAVFAVWDSVAKRGEEYPVPLGVVNCIAKTGLLSECTDTVQEQLDDTAENRV